MAPHTTSYGESRYWDDRYSKEGPDLIFDWYQKYDALAPLLKRYVPKSAKILMSGCGNAGLSTDMVDDGYSDIWNIDISPVVIKALQSKYGECSGLRYMVMDVRKLEFADESFDAVIDKGTLDAIMCGDNSVENCKMLLTEACRVLRPGGMYVLITYGDPRTRMPHLEGEYLSWSIQLHIIPRPGGEIDLVDDKTVENIEEFLLEPATVGEGNRLLPSGISLDSGNVHFIYVCIKKDSACSS